MCGFLIKYKQHTRIGWHRASVHEACLPCLWRIGYFSLNTIDAGLELNYCEIGIDPLCKAGAANTSQRYSELESVDAFYHR